MRFRTKIFLVLGLLVAVALGAALVVVRAETERRVRDDFDERFARTLAAFRQLQQLRRRTVADEVDALARSNPVFRTVLSTVSVADDDLGFGGAPSREEQLRDANLRLQSLLPSLAVATRHEVFAVASAAGELVYTRADPERFGDSLLGVTPLAGAAEHGEETTALWGGGAPEPPSDLALRPAETNGAVHEVVAEPIAFGTELHGLVLVGTRIDAETLAAMRAISGLHVALVGADGALLATLERDTQRALSAALAQGASAAAPSAPTELRLAGARWIAAAADIVPGADLPRFLLLASIDAELAFLRALEWTFLGIGAAVLVAALGFAFVLARGVADPVATLARAAERVGAGDLDARVAIETGDELADLGGAFNRMVDGLRERDRLRRTFARHVSKDVAEELLRHPESLAPRGERREITVLFCDLAGFTTLSEGRSPEDTLACLNEYFAVVCEVVFAAGGTVNELLGDGVLASWGAPVAHPDHAARACGAALAACERLAVLAERWRAAGRPVLRWRIGLHSGTVVVGEMGTDERTKYGMVGDPVNTASRIEGANKAFGTAILASAETRERAGDGFAFREIDAIRVAGRAGALRIFELLGATGEVAPEALARRDRYEAALAAHRARRFAEAAVLLAPLEADDPAACSLAERARRFAAAPPPADWDGVFALDSK